MREQRKRLVGVVTSDKMDKTVVVAVTTIRRHQLYGKVVRHVKKYKAHDEESVCRLGDRVQIIESKPLSRHKRWAVVSVLKQAQ
jgi:small subunit ribosomal protein S17